MSPPVLAAPVSSRLLKLYTATLDDSLGALLALVYDEGYLSHRLIPMEVRYLSIEKHCLTLTFAAQKLRHYMLSHKVTIISRFNPLQYLMTRPTLSGRLARWSMILLQFDITFVPLRTVKGQVLADFLAAHPLPAESPLNDDLPDEQIMSLEIPNIQRWELYFDGASSARKDKGMQTIVPGKAGIGLIFITPDRGMLRFSYHLTDSCTNNEAEYEALITGLQLAISVDITDIDIYGDSQLIIQQVVGRYKILNPKLEQYHHYTMKLLEKIPKVTLYRIPRGENALADALAKLAKEFTCAKEDSIDITVQGLQVLSQIDMDTLHRQDKEGALIAVTESTEDWRQPFIDYLRTGQLPDDKSAAHQIQKRALSYAMVDNVLYRRSFDQMWLRCLSQTEAHDIVKETHAGLCGVHQSGPKMKMKIKRMGYYWPAMMTDCMETAKKCHQCQVHGVVLHQPPNVLHPTIASWSFELGQRYSGSNRPSVFKRPQIHTCSNRLFLKMGKGSTVKRSQSRSCPSIFQRSDCISYSTIYVSLNDTTLIGEAFNKTLVQILKKTLDDNKRRWHEQLLEALWAYRTTFRTPTQSTPYALVYGAEAVLPLEVQLPSLRIAVTNKITTGENAKLRLEELGSLEGKRLLARQNLELYKAKMIQTHDKL
ncbi:uncharacterized protein LOC110037933, partial [Phalaenopsis equestris]|uniref:uncharacterized protein LOC110037933 n=1 Tax=Phalaenopsis equestris TaxID=78828 RepID=UPI0009E2A559